MGFELPLALLGLLAAALPLLAHRMRKRELPRVVLPTFALVARAAARSRRRRTLQDLLLLLLRIAIVAAAALALASPYVTARAPFGDDRVAALAIVIDDSLSMSRKSSGKTLLEHAGERAAFVASTLPPGSEVCVVLAGTPARVIVPLARDLSRAATMVTALSDAATRSDDLASAVHLAARELARSRLPTRRLLVLSDFAKHASLDATDLALDGIDVVAERVGAAAKGGNAFIASATAVLDPTQPGKTSVAVEVQSRGEVPRRARIALARDGKSVVETELILSEGGGRAVLHVQTPDDSGDPRAEVRLIVDDALAADNTAGLVLTRADAVRALLVNGDPHPASDTDELHYVTRALSLVPETLLSLATRSVDPASLAHSRLPNYDVVLLANAPTPDRATAERLLDFVNKGGGLIVAAGHRVDPPTYSAVLDEVLAAHITGLASAPGLRFANAQRSFLSEGLAGLSEVRTTRRLVIEPTAETLLSFEDGSPAVAARDIGDGRSLLVATSLDADFTDLPLRPGFLPLLVSLVREAAGALAVARSHVTPGEVINIPLAKRTAELEITLPDGQIERVTAKPGQRTLAFAATLAIGAYRIRGVDRDSPGEFVPRGAFVVRAPAAESDLTPGPLPQTGTARAASLSALVHRPFANLVFLLAGLLVVVEGFARTRPARSRA